MMNFEDLPSDAPLWLQKYAEAIDASGYSLQGDPEELERQRVIHGHALVAEYFALYLTNPDQAVEHFDTFRKRFGPINREAGILTPLLPEQFGALANIMSLRYEEQDAPQQKQIFYNVIGYLNSQNCRKIAILTTQLRNPRLLSDALLNSPWDFWPNLSKHESYLADQEWVEVAANLARDDSNALIFGLAAMASSIDVDRRSLFAHVYPDTIHTALPVVATRLISEGRFQAFVAEHQPASGYGTWEANIHQLLEGYGPEYHAPLLEAICQNRLQQRPDFVVDGLYPEMTQARFDLKDGKLVTS